MAKHESKNRNKQKKQISSASINFDLAEFTAQKQLAKQQEVSYDDSLSPSWRFDSLYRATMFNEPRVNSEIVAKIVHFLSECESKTIEELLEEPRGAGKNPSYTLVKYGLSESTKNLCKKVLSYCTQFNNEYSEIYRFRECKSTRIFAFRYESIFNIVWWDPGHDIYETHVQLQRSCGCECELCEKSRNHANSI